MGECVNTFAKLDTLEAVLTHLFLCREYPPAPHPPGGIGTYVRRAATMLAEAGESVHVVAQRWAGAAQKVSSSIDGRLTVHRVALDHAAASGRVDDRTPPVAARLLRSACPVQAFAWQAAELGARLIEAHGVDVVEGPDWEAPLSYLLTRYRSAAQRQRRPAFVVHLHSSTEQVYSANGWDCSVTDFAPLVALERATVLAADAVLSPTQFIADEAALRHGLADIRVIPYPCAKTVALERSDATWSNGAICHVGRLEFRKGVVEWAEALSLAAPATLQMHFAGGDTPSDVTGGRPVGDALRERLSPQLRRQVHFHGSLDVDGLRDLLSRSWAAVVPSRWDNLPYSCLEAMASGLPAIISPNGGMKEVVQDAVSGWIASDVTPRALATALERALATSPEERAAMGRAASQAVARFCSPGRVVERHLAFKGDLIRAGGNHPERADALRALLARLPDDTVVAPRFSAMARAVVRDHLPMRDWWRTVPADERRRLLQTAVRRPWHTLGTHGARWLDRWSRPPQ